MTTYCWVIYYFPIVLLSSWSGPGGLVPILLATLGRRRRRRRGGEQKSRARTRLQHDHPASFSNGDDDDDDDDDSKEVNSYSNQPDRCISRGKRRMLASLRRIGIVAC